MTIPLDTNTSVKTTEKLSKYKILEIEVERMRGGGGGSKQQQFRWLWEPLLPSRTTWKTTPTKSLATSTYMNFKLSFLQPTFSGGSSQSSRNPVCLPKSMVWTRSWERKSTTITVAYISFIQLFRERLSDKVHPTTAKCIVGGLQFTVFQRNLKEWQERPWTYQGHPTTMFGKISVRKTIWDPEFSEHLL